MLGRTSSIKTSMAKRFDADQTVWLQAVAHDDLDAKTPYKVIVNEYGYVTADLADDTNSYYVGVPAVDVDDGDLCWMQIGGPIEDMITPSLSVSVGHALEIEDGDVADAGSDYAGVAGEFAVCQTASTSSTTQDALLVPERVTGTT